MASVLVATLGRVVTHLKADAVIAAYEDAEVSVWTPDTTSKTRRILVGYSGGEFKNGRDGSGDLTFKGLQEDATVDIQCWLGHGPGRAEVWLTEVLAMRSAVVAAMLKFPTVGDVLFEPLAAGLPAPVSDLEGTKQTGYISVLYSCQYLEALER